MPHASVHQVSHAAAPMSRREVLRAGSLALGGLALRDVIAGRELAAADGPSAGGRNAVILLYCHGGPSQLETYDLKPEAPSSYRSIFAVGDRRVQRNVHDFITLAGNDTS